MRSEYDKQFNSIFSKMKVDRSWEFYFDPANEDHPMRKRYEYSINHLYGSVLDVGAGDGFGAYLMLWKDQIRDVVCLEVQEKAIIKMWNRLHEHPNIQIVKGNVEDYVAPPFDSVHCGHTLEHVLDFDASLAKLPTLTKDIAVISIPIHGGVSRQHKREFTSVDSFRKEVAKYFDEVEYKVFDIPGQKKKSLVIIAKKKV